MRPVDAIKTVNSGFAELAAKRRQSMTTIPLKDKSTAKILSNENSFDVYFVKKGDKHLNAQMFSGTPEQIQKIAHNMIETIQKMAADGIDVMKEWSKSLKAQK